MALIRVITKGTPEICEKFMNWPVTDYVDPRSLLTCSAENISDLGININAHDLIHDIEFYAVGENPVEEVKTFLKREGVEILYIENTSLI